MQRGSKSDRARDPRRTGPTEAVHASMRRAARIEDTIKVVVVVIAATALAIVFDLYAKAGWVALLAFGAVALILALVGRIPWTGNGRLAGWQQGATLAVALAFVGGAVGFGGDAFGDDPDRESMSAPEVALDRDGVAAGTPAIPPLATPTTASTATPVAVATRTPTAAPTGTATLPPATATPTPEPTATASAAPTATATATPDPTATSTPQPTVTSTPEPTATATLAPTPTASPAPTATTTPARDERQATTGDVVLFTTLKADALSRPAASAMLEGTLIQGAATIGLQGANVTVRDFYARATFENPRDGDDAPWDYGFGFRQIAGNQEYRLVLDSLGRWQFLYGQSLISGPQSAPGMDVSPTGSNTIELIVVGDVAYFRVNGEQVVAVDAGDSLEAGAVFVGTGFFTTNVIEGDLTRYSGFQVWSLDGDEEPPLVSDEATVNRSDADEFARLRDLATQQAADSETRSPRINEQGIVTLLAGVNVRDFYASAHLDQPAPFGQTNWAASFAFRVNGDGVGYALFVASDGTWRLMRDSTEIAAGASDDSMSAEGLHQFGIVVHGDEAYLEINDTYVATLDVSLQSTSSDVIFAFIGQDLTLDSGEQVSIAGFALWSLNDRAGLASGGRTLAFCCRPVEGGRGATLRLWRRA